MSPISVGLSPFSTSITSDVNVSIATSLHQRLPFSGRVHHLSSPDTLCLTQTTFKITEHIHTLVHIKIHMRMRIQIHIRVRSHISISKNICIKIHVVTDTTTFEMELCGRKQATAQAHVRPHCV